MRAYVCAVLGVLGGAAVPVQGLVAQGYQLRLDTRFQSVSFLDVNDVELKGAPLVSTLDATLWGFGLAGLSVRTRARVGGDLGATSFWPGAEPNMQLLEAYAEYARRWGRVQAGRTHVVSRLGYTGFDGARVDLNPGFASLRASVFGGWGMARGTPLTVTSPEINPLSDFIPTERQILVGGTVGWSWRLFEGTLTYQRDVLPNGSAPSILAGDRGAADLVIRPARGWLVTGGGSYDFARKQFNTADVRVRFRHPSGRVSASIGGRYYNPYFDLWTIWGVFSPTPYRAGFGSVEFMLLEGVQVWASGERYQFEDAEVPAPIAVVDDDGWRWSLGATVSTWQPLTFGGAYHMEGTHGAPSVGFDGRVIYEPFSMLAVSAAGGFRRRPLEYRINLARVWNYGLRVDFRPIHAIALTAEARRYDEERWRADNNTIQFDQWRFNVGLTLLYGSGADRPSLHPAILRIPDRRPQ